MHLTHRPLLAATVALGALAPAAPAGAIQPLAVFIAAARDGNATNRERAAEVARGEADADRAFDRLLPAVSVRGVYTYNQRPVEPNLGGATLRIQPENQLDAVIELDVPILDLSARRDVDAVRAGAAVSKAAAEATGLAISQQIARAYFETIGADAVVRAADRSLRAARELLGVAQERFRDGAVPELDVKRAEAAVAAAAQQRSEAELAVDLARRRLASLSGVSPEAVAGFVTDDLHDEGPVEAWLDHRSAHPAVRLANSRVDAAEAAASAADARLFPTLGATATEHLTNASGFADKNDYFQLSLILAWRFDLGVLDGAEAARAGAIAAEAARQQTRSDVDDAIWEAWRRTGADIAASRSAREQLDAASTASDIAELRYQQGAGTQLDVVTAQRDGFLAEVNRIRADVRLSLDRVVLRLVASQPAEAPLQTQQ